ncbi:MAG: hypothetical protein K2F78_05100 [Muribaculaceae bacterium]|nr:hypothetical protein [Muribaculaceae bacterium]
MDVVAPFGWGGRSDDFLVIAAMATIAAWSVKIKKSWQKFWKYKKCAYLCDADMPVNHFHASKTDDGLFAHIINNLTISKTV